MLAELHRNVTCKETDQRDCAMEASNRWVDFGVKADRSGEKRKHIDGGQRPLMLLRAAISGAG